MSPQRKEEMTIDGYLEVQGGVTIRREKPAEMPVEDQA
jgi:hypothetical protein